MAVSGDLDPRVARLESPEQQSLGQPMDAVDKIVVRTPITELWNEAGLVAARKLRHLSTPEIATILRIGPVQFVVADVGKPIHWVPLESCFGFWKAELKSRVLEPNSSVSLEDFPGEHAYSASLWETDGNQPVVVLEKHH